MGGKGKDEGGEISEGNGDVQKEEKEPVSIQSAGTLVCISDCQTLVQSRAHRGQFITVKRVTEDKKGKQSGENKLGQGRDRDEDRKSERQRSS